MNETSLKEQRCPSSLSKVLLNEEFETPISQIIIYLTGAHVMLFTCVTKTYWDKDITICVDNCVHYNPPENLSRILTYKG